MVSAQSSLYFKHNPPSEVDSESCLLSRHISSRPCSQIPLWTPAGWLLPGRFSTLLIPPLLHLNLTKKQQQKHSVNVVWNGSFNTEAMMNTIDDHVAGSGFKMHYCYLVLLGHMALGWSASSGPPPSPVQQLLVACRAIRSPLLLQIVHQRLHRVDSHQR